MVTPLCLRALLWQGYVGVIDAAAFGGEIALVVTLVVAGAGLGSSAVLHSALAVLLPVVAAGVWAVWMAPRSARRLADPARFVGQVALFVVAGPLVAAAGRLWWGVVFAVVTTAVFALSRRTGSS